MKNRITLLYLSLISCLFVLIFIDLKTGSVSISFSDIFAFLNADLSSEKKNIISQFRFPKMCTALLAGASLSICGVLMQTLFQNPLAGPYVLGINSGANFMVAIFILGGTSLLGISEGFINSIGIQGASIIGACAMLLLMMIISEKMNQQHALLLIGIMLAQLISALQSLLEFFSNAEQLKRFFIWNLGSISNTTNQDVLILFIFVLLGCIAAIMISHRLDVLSLGVNYSTSLGINVKQLRIIIILITGLLAGITTAYCGPIAFVGIAVPHISRLLFKTSRHNIILSSSILIGAILLIVCDIISQLPGNGIILPLNVVTSVFGVPIIIYLLFKSSKNYFV
jgi:iron complex transport system permease protein